MPSPQVAQLATDLAPYLAALLPVLAETGKTAGGAMVKAFGEKLGAGAPGALKRLWGRLRSEVEARPDSLDALSKAAASPARDDTLRHELAALLMADEGFRYEMAALFTEVTAQGVEGVVQADIAIDVHAGDLLLVDVEDAAVVREAGVREIRAQGRIGETKPGSSTVGVRFGRLGAGGKPDDSG